MDLALNSLQKLMCHKTQTTYQQPNILYITFLNEPGLFLAHN